MAYGTSSISNNISSDANFRTWGSSISTLWQSVGLTQTADTGQINWTTVVRPGTNSFAGYEIFRLTTDTEHANYPLFIRVDYGVAGTTSLQRLGIQVGEGTDGAGTLTGVTGTQRIFAAAGTANTSSFTHYCSAGDGYFAYAGSWSPATNSTTALFNQLFIIERLRDNTGAPTADGIYTFYAGVTASTQTLGYTQIVRADDINPAYSSAAQSLRMATYVPNMSGVRGLDLYLYTHQPADYAIYNPCLSNLFYWNADLAADTNIAVDMYGTSRTFKTLGRNTTTTENWLDRAFQHTNSGLALLWE